jgi:hypothetical protein
VKASEATVSDLSALGLGIGQFKVLRPVTNHSEIVFSLVITPGGLQHYGLAIDDAELLATPRFVQARPFVSPQHVPSPSKLPLGFRNGPRTYFSLILQSCIDFFAPEEFVINMVDPNKPTKVAPAGPAGPSPWSVKVQLQLSEFFVSTMDGKNSGHKLRVQLGMYADEVSMTGIGFDMFVDSTTFSVVANIPVLAISMGIGQNNQDTALPVPPPPPHTHTHIPLFLWLVRRCTIPYCRCMEATMATMHTL